jgi:hypothetical protein
MKAPAPTDWNGVALARLVKVLGPEAGRGAMDAALRELQLPSLRSADDLYRLSRVLARAGGFASAVGGLLSLHAVMHGARGDAP